MNGIYTHGHFNDLDLDARSQCTAVQPGQSPYTQLGGQLAAAAAWSQLAWPSQTCSAPTGTAWQAAGLPVNNAITCL